MADVYLIQFDEYLLQAIVLSTEKMKSMKSTIS